MWIWFLTLIFGGLLIKGISIYLKRKSTLQLLLKSAVDLVQSPTLNTHLQIMERLDAILRRLDKIESRIDDMDQKIEQLAWTDLNSNRQELVRVGESESTEVEEFLLVKPPANNTVGISKAELLNLIREFENEVFEKEEQYHYSGWKQKLEDKLSAYPKIVKHLLNKSKTLSELRLNLGRLRSYIESIGGMLGEVEIDQFTEDITYIDKTVGSVFEKALNNDKEEINTNDILSSLNNLLSENGVPFQLPKEILPEFSIPRKTFQKNLENGLANPGTAVKFMSLKVMLHRQVNEEKSLLPMITNPSLFLTLREIVLLREDNSKFHQFFLTWNEYPKLDFESLAAQNLIAEVEHQLVKQGIHESHPIETCFVFYFIGTRSKEMTSQLLEKLLTETSYQPLKNLIEIWSTTNLIE